MKCSAIKLSTRCDQPLPRLDTSKENTIPPFKGDGGHSYSFPFVRPVTAKSTTLAITNINPPENIQGFNTGASLERWSQKRVRWKSAKISKTPTEFDKEFCYETLEGELSLLLDEDDRQSPDASLDNLRYEVHTDIEKLLQESGRNGDEEVKEEKKRRKKKKKSKTIKFSKPSTPQTEQVIRVDVTSNVSNEEKKVEVKIGEESDDGGEKRKELKRNLWQEETEMCDEEFIIKCRQLALRQRRRRL